MFAVVGTCCVYIETGKTFRPMQTDANIVDQQHPTMLGVVGTCCVRLHGPKSLTGLKLYL